MSKGNILLISYYFYPSLEVGAKRPSETALHLMRKGYSVTVLRAVDPRAKQRSKVEGLDDLRIFSVKIPRKRITELYLWLKRKLRPRNAGEKVEGSWADPAGRPKSSKRTPLQWLRRQVLACDTLFQGNKLWLFLSLTKLMIARRGEKYDLVVASGPPMVSYICGYLVARLNRTRLLLDFRDPWYLHGDPELTTVMLGHPLANFENRLARRCAARCARITAASPGTKRHLVERLQVAPEAVEVLRNGFDREAVVETPPPVGKLEFVYAGSLYWNRNPFPFLESLGTLLDNGEIDRRHVKVRLIGRCEEWKGIPLRPWIEENGMEHIVEILPFMSPDELAVLVAESNVLLNFAQGQKRQIPAKSYDYIAANRDVLVITEADSDVAALFREAGIGTVVEPGDEPGFQRAIRQLYDRYVSDPGGVSGMARDVYRYSREAQLEAFEAIVDDVLSETQASRRN